MVNTNGRCIVHVHSRSINEADLGYGAVESLLLTARKHSHTYVLASNDYVGIINEIRILSPFIVILHDISLTWVSEFIDTSVFVLNHSGLLGMSFGHVQGDREKRNAIMHFTSSVHYLCLNPGSYDFYRDLQVNMASVSLVRNYVDTSLFYPRIDLDNSRRILIVGNDVPTKRFDLRKYLPNEYCVSCVGISDNSDFREVKRADMPEVYRDHDILFHPSEFEGMSMAILEALESGLRVICSEALRPGLKGIDFNVIYIPENVLAFPDENRLDKVLVGVLSDIQKRPNPFKIDYDSFYNRILKLSARTKIKSKRNLKGSLIYFKYWIKRKLCLVQDIVHLS